MGFPFFLASGPPTPSGVWIVGLVLSGTGRVLGGRNWKRSFEKTDVGFGRTELSLRLSWTGSCALSSGHGPRGEGFQEGSPGMDFHVFWGAVLRGSKLTRLET